MIDRPQAAALAIGRTGCYFLSILKLAEKWGGPRRDALLEYENAVGRGTLGNDCMVLDAGRLLSILTNNGWTCLKAGPGHELPLTYQCASAEELEILRYERPVEPGDTASSERAHFVVGDGQGKLSWDPYGESRTVRVGKVVSKRVFRRT
jgi:hypothetical protein